MALEALLHKGPLTISAIQAEVLLASGSITAAVDRVESMSLVVRKTTAKDRRARVLELTPKGRRLIERAFAEHARHLELKKLGQFVAPTLDRSHPEAEDKRRR